jgi:hypothetical protein
MTYSLGLRERRLLTQGIPSYPQRKVVEAFSFYRLAAANLPELVPARSLALLGLLGLF